MQSFELPSNDNIFTQMNLARDDAIKMANKFGIHFSSENDLTCQLRVCEPEREKEDENESLAVAEVTADSLCESIGQIHLENDDDEVPLAANYELYGLRDYTDQNIVVDKLCPFTKIKDNTGQSKVVRKSSVLWALTNTKCGLSTDRLQRVQGIALEKANRRTLPTTQHVFDEVDKSDAKMVWKDPNVHIGDWCFFLRRPSARTTDDLLVGRVTAFRYCIASFISRYLHIFFCSH